METRLTPRVPAKMRAVLYLEKDADQNVSLAGGKYHKVTVFDISEGGLGLIVKKFYLPRGTKVEIVVSRTPFKLAKPVEIKGEVRYCLNYKYNSYKCGIKILEISDVHKKAISSFVEKSLKK
jgi:c-di-GMP-binding flagellar brake protein YcgR